MNRKILSFALAQAAAILAARGAIAPNAVWNGDFPTSASATRGTITLALNGNTSDGAAITIGASATGGVTLTNSSATKMLAAVMGVSSATVPGDGTQRIISSRGNNTNDRTAVAVKNDGTTTGYWGDSEFNGGAQDGTTATTGSYSSSGELQYLAGWYTPNGGTKAWLDGTMIYQYTGLKSANDNAQGLSLLGKWTSNDQQMAGARISFIAVFSDTSTTESDIRTWSFVDTQLTKTGTSLADADANTGVNFSGSETLSAPATAAGVFVQSGEDNSITVNGKDNTLTAQVLYVATGAKLTVNATNVTAEDLIAACEDATGTGAIKLIDAVVGNNGTIEVTGVPANQDGYTFGYSIADGVALTVTEAYSRDYSISVTGNGVWSTKENIEETGTWQDSQLSWMTIANEAEAILTFDSAVSAGYATLNGPGAITLVNGAGAAVNIARLAFSDTFGGLTLENFTTLPAFSNNTLDIDTISFTGTATLADVPAPIGGQATINGSSVDYLGTFNISQPIAAGKSVNVRGNKNIVFDTADQTFERMVLVQYANNATQTVTQNGGTINITSTGSVESSGNNTAPLLIGHYQNGSATLNTLGGEMILAGAARLGWNSSGTWNIGGGETAARVATQGIRSGADGHGGVGTLNLKPNGTLDLTGDRGIEFMSTSSVLNLAGGTINAKANTKITDAGAFTLAEGTTSYINIDAGKTLALNNSPTGTGSLVIGGNGTLALGYLRDLPRNVTVADTVTVSISAIAEDGGNAIYVGGAGISVAVVLGNGSTQTFVSGEDGFVAYPVQVAGTAAWLAYEFDYEAGNTAKTGFENSGYETGMNMSADYMGGTLIVGEDAFTDDGMLYTYAHPFKSGLSLPVEWSAAVRCTVPKYKYAAVITFGSNGDGVIGLVAGEEANTMLLVRTTSTLKTIAEGNGTILASAKVSNAYSSQHLFVFTKSAREVNVYCDGKLIAKYDSAEDISFGSTGFQIGSVLSGVSGMNIVRFAKGEAAANTLSEEDQKAARIDSVRLYKCVLSTDAIAALKEEFPYVSENGLSTRTLGDGDTAWEQPGKWNVQNFGDASATSSSAPIAGSVVEIAAAGENAIDVNLAADTDYESIAITGGGSLTLSPASNTSGKITASSVEIAADVTVLPGTVDFRSTPITIADGSKLLFDYSGYTLGGNGRGAAVVEELTGLVSGGGAIDIIPPAAAGITADLSFDSTAGIWIVTISSDHAGEDVYWTHGTTVLNIDTKVTVSGEQVYPFADDTIIFNGAETVAIADGGNNAASFAALDLCAGASLTLEGGKLANRTIILSGGVLDCSGTTEVEGTLTLRADTDTSVFATAAPVFADGSTLVINGGTVTIAHDAELPNVSGTGTLYIPAGVSVTTTGEVNIVVAGEGRFIPEVLPAAGATTAALQNAAAWSGTVVLTGLELDDDSDLGLYGNSDSFLEMTDCNGYVGHNTVVAPKLTLADGNAAALNIANGYSGNLNTFRYITGSGTLKVTKPSGNPRERIVVQDATTFTGSVLVNENNAGAYYGVYFGEAIPETVEDMDGKIVIDAAATVKLGADARWYANTGIEVYGRIDTLGGTLAGTVDFGESAVVNWIGAPVANGAKVKVLGFDKASASGYENVTILVDGEETDLNVTFADDGIYLKGKGDGLSVRIR